MQRAVGYNSVNHVPNCSQQRNVNLSHQYVTNQVNWRKGYDTEYCRHLMKSTIANYFKVKPSHKIPTILESWLFHKATSKEEYLNRERLYQLMWKARSMLHEKFSVSRGGGSLNTSSNSVNSCVPQPHATNYDMGLINQRVGSGTIQYNKKMGQTGMELSMQSQTSDLAMESSDISEAFILFPTWKSVLVPQDLVQYQQKIDSHNISTHVEQPSVCGVEPTVPQSGAWFVNHVAQSVDCKRKSLDQLQLATKRRKIVSGTCVPSIPHSSYGQTSAKLDPKSYGMSDRSNLMGTYFGSNSGMHSRSMDPIPVDIEGVEGRTGFNRAEKQTKSLSSTVNGVRHRNLMQLSKAFEAGQSLSSTVNGRTHWNPMLLSKALEAGQTSEEPNPKSSDMIKSRTLMRTDLGLNSSMPTLKNDTISTYVDDIKDNTGFNVAGPSAIKNISELEADQEKQMKSEDARVRKIQRSEIFESPKWYIFPSQGLEAGQISEEPVNKDCSMTDNNSEENHIRSNSSMNAFSKNPIIVDVDEIKDRTEFNELETNVVEKVTEPDADQEKKTKSPNAIVNEKESNVIVNAFSQSFKSEMVPSKCSYASQISEDPECKNHGVTDSSNLMEIDIGSNLSMHNLNTDPIVTDIENIQGRTEPNLPDTNAIEEVIEPKDNQEKQTKSSNATANVVSLTELFTSDQIKEHIVSLRKQSGQSATGEEMEISANACQLCAKEKLFFAPLPIFCLGCNSTIKQNSNYFYRKEEKLDAGCCLCTGCVKQAKRGRITLSNGTSIPKTLLEKRKNNEVLEEPWVECNKCKKWQHQVCTLYNNKRDLDSSVEYICPVCCLEEIENGMRVPSPETAIFHAKDLPKTTLSDHLEDRLFRRLIEEKKSYTTKNNLVEVLTAENLSVREVVSVDKILNVEKQFLDILAEKETYPAEFPYRSRVILLFQQIEGADICIFAMYVQEFGSECGYPNQRCVYVSYLDSVKYFRPQRGTAVKNEGLRTFVYHEILIGYLDFVKKRGFGTCFIWSCPPKKGQDYILNCHPITQKFPKEDHLQKWYHSMLVKATKENIVVGLTNIYDHSFVPTGNWNSKVTASQLPYFGGDHWCSQAVILVNQIGKETGGDYEKPFNKLAKRSLKDMGHDVKPPSRFAKDVVVMHKLGQSMLHMKEQFIVAHLQYSCMHCHEVIVSGKKRWFCTECNKIQECERCHTSDVHTTARGVEHRLSQVFMDNVPLSTEKNNTTIYNGLIEDRVHFLGFCQENQLQFDTLRHAKYASMMILYHLNNLHTQLCPSEH